MFGLAAKFRKNRTDRVTRLAAAIESLCDRDLAHVEETERVEALRLRGARDLHAACKAFVDQVNSRLSHSFLILSPDAFAAAGFHEDSANMLQINLRGRLLQIEYHATEELYSTDDFRTPYILKGSVRAFNQELLANNRVDEQLLFYCPKGDSGVWHLLDCRTYRTGRLDGDYLTTAIEKLI